MYQFLFKSLLLIYVFREKQKPQAVYLIMMKFENNWKQKSIENLEKENWGYVDPAESNLVQRVSRLRKVPLDEFAIDDIRFMIGQQTGLPWLLELALEILEENLFAEGNYYEGDLLNAVLQITPAN